MCAMNPSLRLIEITREIDLAANWRSRFRASSLWPPPPPPPPLHPERPIQLAGQHLAKVNGLRMWATKLDPALAYALEVCPAQAGLMGRADTQANGWLSRRQLLAAQWANRAPNWPAADSLSGPKQMLPAWAKELAAPSIQLTRRAPILMGVV